MLYGTREEEDDEQIESESSDKKVRAFELIAKGNELYRDRMNRFQPLIGDPDITPRRLGEVLSESAAQLSEHNQPLMALDKINDLERIIHSVQQRQPSETTFNNIVSPTHDMLTAIHTLAPTLKAAELDITRKPIEALARQLLDDSQVLQFTQYWEYTLETNDRFAIEQTAFLKPYYQASIIASRKAMAPRLDEGNAPELAIVGNAAGGNPKLLSLLSERRMAGVNLACQLYRMDHAEKYPDSLEKLVPKYIPAVPDNLVLRNGEKIRLVSIKNHLGGEAPHPLLRRRQAFQRITISNPPRTPITTTRAPASAENTGIFRRSQRLFQKSLAYNHRANQPHARGNQQSARSRRCRPFWRPKPSLF